ncbi:TPA: flagellar protein FliT [Salmonella enterica subsp. enterica serovar Muenchen]
MMREYMFSSCEALYDISMLLLDLARKENWDEFSFQAEEYVVKVQDFACGDVFSNAVSEEQDEMKVLIIKVLENTTKIQCILAVRLNNLKIDMSSLHHAARVSQLYSLHKVQ